MSERIFAGRRVVLRPLTEADAPAALEAVLASAAQLKRRFTWAQAVLGLEDMRRFVRAKTGEWEAGTSSTFAVFETRGGRLVGVLSLDPIVRETLKAQLSVWIRAGEQDKGYAVEAGRLALEYAFRKLALHRTYARIDPSNRAARRVGQKLGFRYEGCLQGDKRLGNRWIDQECWGMLRADWKPRSPHPGPLPRSGRGRSRHD